MCFFGCVTRFSLGKKNKTYLTDCKITALCAYACGKNDSCCGFFCVFQKFFVILRHDCMYSRETIGRA